MLKLTINGEPQNLPEPLTVAQLLDRLGYDRKRVAVEINQEVVPQKEHEQHQLAGGDAIEIVSLVGGGSAAPPAIRQSSTSFHGECGLS
jgi:thiamine biosynthesis protein ThiS